MKSLISCPTSHGLDVGVHLVKHTSNKVTYRNLTALSIRIGALFLFIQIFDHFGSNFLTIYLSSTLYSTKDQIVDPFNKYFLSGTFLNIVNIVVSLFLFVKADWLSRKLIKQQNEVGINLNAKSLSQVIFMTVGIIWLATSIYLLPEFVKYCIEFIANVKGEDYSPYPKINAPKFIIRTLIAFFLIFKAHKLSSWIVGKI